MSWLRCDQCDALIDTDFEPGAYNEQRDVWLCTDCRPAPFGSVNDDPGETERKERDKSRAQEFFGQMRWDRK